MDSGGGGGLGPSQRQIRGLRIPEHPTFEDCILSYPSADHRTTSPNMGRSAKMKMRPTQKQKQVSKIAKAAAQPLKKREPSPEPVVAPSGGGGKKKRKSMRVKADKVSSWPPAGEAAIARFAQLTLPEVESVIIAFDLPDRHAHILVISSHGDCRLYACTLLPKTTETY